MKPLVIKLSKGERIIAAVPELCAGPGWSNAPIWVYIMNGRVIRTECIQPDERTPAMHALFGPCLAAHNAMISAVQTKEAK